MENIQRWHVVAGAAVVAALSTLLGVGKPLAELRISGYSAGTVARFVVGEIVDFGLTFVLTLLFVAGLLWAMKRWGATEEP